MLLPAAGEERPTLHWQDRRLAAGARLPGWYLPLRLRLTVVACASLLSGAFLVPA